jgi:hypothetical protein
MSQGSLAHQRRQSERLQRKQTFAACLAENLRPERAFYLVRKRIEWLNDKIAWALANEQKTFHYTEEREALLWMLDKIAELSRKLLAVEPQRKEES